SVSTSVHAHVHAQTAASQGTPPQTARQALIEMFFGQAPNHLEKHLPDVTRRAFQSLEGADGQSALGAFSMLTKQAQGKDKVETFDTGSTLFTAKDLPGGSYDSMNMTVERDELAGDEDQIELALHMIRGGKEETLPFILRFIFSMKMEADVWRLNEISFAMRLPLADPAFLKSLLERQRSQNEQMTIASMRSVVAAENSYQSARGFACTLSALGSTNKQPGHGRYYLYDSQLVSGKKNGYVFAISGCDTTHYQLVAEPTVPDSGQRAFCSDESGTVRASADGKAATCLSSGEVVEEKAPAGGISEAGAPQGKVSSGTPQAAGTQLGQRVRVSAGVSEGLIVSKVPPIYPERARQARITGTVVLKALINQAGDVESLSLISGHPLLAPAAMDAVKQWKYRPYLLNGKAVNVETQITVNFALSGQ
ncbi:MAG: energy transducer TonB, partial [Candidatus Sulfotelmatobacter sp.]